MKVNMTAKSISSNENGWFIDWRQSIIDFITVKFGMGGILSDFLAHCHRYKKIGETVLKYSREDSKILDIGVGHGYTCNLLKYLGRNNFTGLDLDPQSCLFPDIREKTLQCDLELIQTKALPFADDSFDIIIMAEVLEHLHPYKIRDIMLDIKRLLASQGILILSTPNLACIENRVSLIFGGILRHRRGSIIDSCHTREYTHKELLDFFNSIGFNIYDSFYQSPRQFIIIDNEGACVDVPFLNGLIKNPNFKNIARLTIGVMKQFVPSFQEVSYFILKKGV